MLCGAHGACDHLDCNPGAFLVVFVATSRMEAFIRTYSSRNGVWSEPATVQQHGHFDWKPGSPLVGNSYFRCRKSTAVFKYNVVTREITVIQLPPEAGSSEILLMPTKDGRLGFTSVNKSSISMWSREIGQDGDVRWAQSRHIDLEALLPHDLIFSFLHAVGFADDLELIFVRTIAGAVIVDLKSGQVKKVAEGCFLCSIVPFTSF